MLRRAIFRIFSDLMRRLLGTPVARAIWKIPGSRSIYRRLISGLRPETVVVDGHTIHLDVTDSLLLSVNGAYEELEYGLFAQCVDPGSTVLDIGGHIGYYTLQAARAVGPDGHVYTFEPAPENFRLLELNVRENGYTNVTLVNAAVSDEPGEQLLFVSELNTGDHRLGDDAAGREGIAVQTVTIDEYFGGSYPDVSVIKMDVQGSEPRVIAGAHDLLAASSNVLLFTELSPEHLGLDGARDFLDTLAEFGFELFELREDAECVEPVRPGLLLDRMRGSERGEHTNLVCAKGGRARERLSAATAVAA